MRMRLIVRCWLSLLWIDLRLRVQEYPEVRSFLLKRKTSDRAPVQNPTVLSEAMDLASIFYLRRLSPLHRALCHTLLLQDHGWPAELVVGLQLLPAESYAWVEVEGVPVHERAGALDTIQVIDRCGSIGRRERSV